MHENFFFSIFFTYISGLLYTWACFLSFFRGIFFLNFCHPFPFPTKTNFSVKSQWSSCLPKLCTTWNRQQQPAWNETRSWVPCCIWNAPYFFHTYLWPWLVIMRKLKTLSTQPFSWVFYFIVLIYFLKKIIVGPDY